MSESSTPAATAPTPTSSTPTEATETVLGTVPAVETPPAAPAAPVVPEAYEFTAPQVNGQAIEVDPAALDGFKTLAKDSGLTQEQFAKLAPYGAQLIAEKLTEAVAKAMPEHLQKATQDGWVNTIKADAEIGGDKLAGAMADAARAIDAYGTPKLREALDLTRAGNHPEIVKFFAKVGKAMGDATGLLTGRPAAGSKPLSREQAARNIYNDAGGNYPPVEA